MSRIDSLIAELAPQRVQHRKLRDIEPIQRGKRLVRNQLLDSGEIPVYQNSMTPLGYYREANVGSGRTFIIAAGAAGEIGHSDVDFWAADDVYFYHEISDVDQKYLYYVLQSKSGLIKSRVRRASIPRLPKNAIEDMQIPVPPLEVQRAIVEILDTFSKLEAELEAELEARKQQYEHYRAELLSSADETTVIPLRQVAKYSDTRIESSNLNSFTFVGVDNLIADKRGKTEASYLPNTSRLTAYESGDVLIGNIRPYLKKVWLADSHGGCSGDVLAVRILKEAREHLDYTYLYFLLSSDSFFAYNMQHAKGAKMPRGNKQAILNYPIPLPPLEEQRRIVAILNKFDALVNDLSIGLPAELVARRQQYEYYRDKLLTFKELEASV